MSHSDIEGRGVCQEHARMDTGAVLCLLFVLDAPLLAVEGSWDPLAPPGGRSRFGEPGRV